MFILGALRQRENRIAAAGRDHASQDDLHQAGVLWMQCFRACSTRPRWPGWRNRSYKYYDTASGRLVEARATAVRRNDKLGEVAVLCDQALLDAQHPTSRVLPDLALEILLEAHLTLESMLSTSSAADEIAIIHQLAICCDFLARLNSSKKVYENDAREYFSQLLSRSPDNNRAHCSFLLASALRAGKSDDSDAILAYTLAKESGHYDHVRRARMIMHFGARGNRALRRLKYWYA